MQLRKVSIGRGVGVMESPAKDNNGEEHMCYPCDICTGFALSVSLIVIHMQNNNHGIVHEACAIASEIPWTRCSC